MMNIRPLPLRPLSASWVKLSPLFVIALLPMVIGTVHCVAAQPIPAPDPQITGLWYDDTGQGAIEIGPCGNRLCGRIVWLKNPMDKTGRPITDGLNPKADQRKRPVCGLQVIGDLKPQPTGAWDEGWIYDPKEGKSYDVEIKLRSPDRLQVVGYLGTKFLSESFIWTRAPAELKRCA